MSTNTRIPRPVYAVAGIGELAATQLRKLSTIDLRGELESLRAGVPARVAELRAEAPARLAELQSKVSTLRAELPGRFAEFRAELPGTINGIVSDARVAYADLVARGERVVEARLATDTAAEPAAETGDLTNTAATAKPRTAVKAPRAAKAVKNAATTATNKAAPAVKKAVRKATRKTES